MVTFMDCCRGLDGKSHEISFVMFLWDLTHAPSRTYGFHEFASMLAALGLWVGV
jgi:hypothetical protein